MRPLKALRAGEVIHQKYAIEKMIGRGGFSAVYKANQLGMDRPVALKIMRPNLTHVDDEEALARELNEFSQRFAQEARVLSKLRSAATVTVYDYGMGEDGFPYMALEFVDGKPLSALTDLPISSARVQRMLEQALDSLKEAHFHGILHRDIKPANIMLYDYMGERDLIKLLDFGIAKLLGEQEHREDLTRQDMLIGTPRYMSPEMVYGEEVRPASDLYALGLVAFELLTGKPGVDGPNPMAILTAQTSPTPILIPDNLPVSPALKAVIERMVAKDLRVRYASAEEVLQDLRRSPHDEQPSPDATVPVARPSLSRPMPMVGADPYSDTDQSPRQPHAEAIPTPSGISLSNISAEMTRPPESTDTMRRKSLITLDEAIDMGSAPAQPRLLQERSMVLNASWAILSLLIISFAILSIAGVI
jgi:eukaryotic-like serine/threonine-protein kinase